MKRFSRVVFASVGILLGMFVGVLNVFALGVFLVWLYDRRYGEGVGDNPGIGMLIIVLLPVGAILGSLVGLAAGIVIPFKAEQKSKLTAKLD